MNNYAPTISSEIKKVEDSGKSTASIRAVLHAANMLNDNVITAA